MAKMFILAKTYLFFFFFYNLLKEKSEKLQKLCNLKSFYNM